MLDYDVQNNSENRMRSEKKKIMKLNQERQPNRILNNIQINMNSKVMDSIQFIW